MFRPGLSARLQFWAADSPASLNSSVATKDLIAHRIRGDAGKKERKAIFVLVLIIFAITAISL